mmetsp:Transcript_13887/g.51844  ORF Transcript_13887/g.51844 Transcript_13887/m.51844 type:complete len:445 (-) Transcript_13887:205-1539(-)
MCRLVVYKGPEVSLEDVLVRPEHNIVQQSRDASYHPGCTSKRNYRVNGDGFGVAWYNPRKPYKGPCSIHFASPAWHNRNLLNICRFVDSNVIMGHVRAAFSGVEDDKVGSTFSVRVSEENCHPFTYGRYSFCHNGGVTDFPKMKRALQQSLSDEAYSTIQGNTDSEHCFAIFLDQLPSKTEQLTADEIAEALRATIRVILNLAGSIAPGQVPPSSLNFAVSDGVHCVATRFRNGRSEPPSLYYCYGSLREKLARRQMARDAGVESGSGSGTEDIVEMAASNSVGIEAETTSQGSRSGRSTPCPMRTSSPTEPMESAFSTGFARPVQVPSSTEAQRAGIGLLGKALSGELADFQDDMEERHPVGDTLIISSEPLTRSQENWTLVPRNSIIVAQGCTNTVASPICSVRIEQVLHEEDIPAPQLSRSLPAFAASPIHRNLVGCRMMP